MSWLSGQPTNAQVSCRESCRIHRIPTEILWHWVQAHSEAGRTLLEALGTLAMQRQQGQFHQGGYLALIAHDGRKQDLGNLASAHVALLQQRPLLTTSHTGLLLEQQLNLCISRRVSSGPLGGDQEVGSLVVAGLVEAVLFFPDPLSSQPHSADV
ncbi:MAG: methylglyoxal synthase, partial [Cyanobium sp.]